LADIDLVYTATDDDPAYWISRRQQPLMKASTARSIPSPKANNIVKR
jgi:hypothetical protein